MAARPGDGQDGARAARPSLPAVAGAMSSGESSACAILKVQELTIQRGNVTILERLSWSVAPGEHWVILGPNGSGKTSLLAALTGYLTPTAGSIHVLGAEYGATDWRELRQAVGLVSSSAVSY